MSVDGTTFSRIDHGAQSISPKSSRSLAVSGGCTMSGIDNILPHHPVETSPIGTASFLVDDQSPGHVSVLTKAQCMMSDAHGASLIGMASRSAAWKPYRDGSWTGPTLIPGCPAGRVVFGTGIMSPARPARAPSQVRRS